AARPLPSRPVRDQPARPARRGADVPPVAHEPAVGDARRHDRPEPAHPAPDGRDLPADLRVPGRDLAGGPAPLHRVLDDLLDRPAVPVHRLGWHVPDLRLAARLRGGSHAAVPDQPAAPRRPEDPTADLPARGGRRQGRRGRQDHSPQGTRPPGPPRETPLMSAYREFTGKSVEEALKVAREEFGVELNDLDFEILTAGSRGVLGMGAEPARIVAAPRSALGGAAPKREAAATTPLPPAPPREDRGFGDRDRDRGPRREGRGGDRGGFRGGDRDRGPRRDERPGGDRDRG